MRFHYQIGLTIGAMLLGACVPAAHAAGAGDRRSLIDAVRDGDARAIRALVTQKADINRRQPDGTTALHWAAYGDDLAAVDLLLRHGADPNAANDYGITPLLLAAANGSEAVARALLIAGANPNASNCSSSADRRACQTPLMTAARTGNVPVVKLLITHKANVASTELSRGQTALMWALSEGHLGVAEVLIEHGADVRAGSTSGFTPLMFAARNGDKASSRLLLSLGAEVNAVAADGSTPLLVAVARGHIDLAKWLLENGADPNISKAGYTPLHFAVGRWETISTTVNHTWPEGKEGDEWRVMDGVPLARKGELVKALLDHGANVNAVTTKDPPRYGQYQFYASMVGATPLIYAAMAADADLMRLLLAHGANPGIATKDGVTALQAAAGYGRRQVWEELTVTEEMTLAALQVALEAGNDINAADSIGETSLHHSVWGNMPRVARFLVTNGANFELRNKYGATPLAAAMGLGLPPGTTVVEERPAVAAVLRELGAKSDAPQTVPFAVDRAPAP